MKPCAAVFLPLLLTACMAEPLPELPAQKAPEIRIMGSISQISDTKVSDLGFTQGDQIGLYAVNYTSDGKAGRLEASGNQATNVRFVYQDGRWIPDYAIYFKDGNTSADLYAYYPWVSQITSVDYYRIEIPADQSSPEAYESADFLWAKATDVAPTSSVIRLDFKHRMSGAQVFLEQGTGFEAGEWEQLEKAVLLSNLSRQALVNLEKGEAVPYGSVPATGTVPMAVNGGWRAIVVPQTVDAGLPLLTLTVGNTVYHYVKESDYVYMAGTLHRFTVTVNKKTVSGEYAFEVQLDILPWMEDGASHSFSAREYVVARMEEAGTLSKVLRTAGFKAERIGNLKVEGPMNASDFFFMRDTMSVLEAVNLKNASIEACRIVNRNSMYQDFPANTIPQYAFYEKGIISFVFPDNLETIDQFAFGFCRLLSTISDFPPVLKEIAPLAFSNCSSLTGKLVFPDSVESLGMQCFVDCSSIVELRFGAGLKYIGNAAFSRDIGLRGTRLVLPDNVETIESYAFADCLFSGSLVIPPKITTITDHSFSDNFDGKLVLPEGVRAIEEGAFSGCGFTGGLILPASLKQLGRYVFGGCNGFTGRLVLPEGLSALGSSAFTGCRGFTGTLEIPAGIYSIPLSAFEYCHGLEEIILHANVEMIQGSAFGECTGLRSFVCLAQTPPVINTAGDPFEGVPKDNFTVEVPEGTVNAYALAPGWRQFRRFAPHREFALDGVLVRTLSAGGTRSFQLRTLPEAAWSVESHPNWVSVTPESGSGSATVTVEIQALPEGAEDRTGEIVFLMNGYDYRARLQAEQFSYPYSDGGVINLFSHTEGSGVQVVFVGDGYDARDISSGKYLSDMRETAGYFFEIEPFKSWKGWFDANVVVAESPDSGVGDVNTIVKTRLGSHFLQTGAQLDVNKSACYAMALKVPGIGSDILPHSLIVVVENTTAPGSRSFLSTEEADIALLTKAASGYPYDYRGSVQYEACGRAFGKLGDESVVNNFYLQAGTDYVDFKQGKLKGWYSNLSDTGNRQTVPWSHLLTHPDYAGTVDVYEGGFGVTRGVFRSEPNSCMSNHIPYFNAISRQAIVQRIMTYGGAFFSLEAFYAKDVRSVQ